jgi:hypothetical protein
MNARLASPVWNDLVEDLGVAKTPRPSSRADTVRDRPTTEVWRAPTERDVFLDDEDVIAIVSPIPTADWD